MKRVFVSYSIEDRNLHLITLLLEHLRKNNYSVSVSNQWIDSDIKIASSDVFIGIVTNKSNSVDYVVKEWKTAKKNNIQNILIVEDGISINDSSISYIRFNRSSPQEAINELFNINKSVVSSQQKKNSNDVADILLGVAVVAGMAALISLLSKNK